jgi:CDP-paratose 2-epimerase
MKSALVTGSGGLIGSQTVKFLVEKGYKVIGIDNDMRSYFFGPSATTSTTSSFLTSQFQNFQHHNLDIRDYSELEKVFKNNSLEIVVHTAAQPSHDWAAREPMTDFSVNATGTLNLLELTRLYSPSATFIFTSTNKVYGDRPNFSYYSGVPDLEYYYVSVTEDDTRYEARRLNNSLAEVDEKMPIDQCKHSIFGASKVAADIMVQEYGKYFGMNTVVFRGGCLTGPDHAGAELHGFLSYLIKCMVHGKPYTVYGYKGKQVRDNIHSEDLVRMFWEYHQNPRPGEVYNAGGGRENSTSILEAIEEVNKILVSEGRLPWSNFSITEKPREGDHVWYITSLNKFQEHYPNWKLEKDLKTIIKEITQHELQLS